MTTTGTFGPRTAASSPPRYLFIGGLHRSGTSLIGRLASGLPGAGGITDAPVPENEGVYLQGAIPHTALCGQPMHFATNPVEHMTETHPLNTLQTRLRMEYDWNPWFEDGLRWRVEKSPVNLTRMRLLQQLFPTCQFIVMLRHPEAVAASVSSWVEASMPVLHSHWIEAHKRLRADLPYLHAVLCLRYEDVVADPALSMRRIAAFLDLPYASASEAIADGNVGYRGTTPLSPSLGALATEWGYAPNLKVLQKPCHVQHPLRAVREHVASQDSAKVMKPT